MSSRGLKTAKKRRKPSGFVALFALAALSSGCASSQYMGISLRPGAADPALQMLATRASVGNKQAQLDLGVRLFHGNGVTSDARRACRLFRMAATETPDRLWVYTPSPGGGAPARVLPISNKAPASGLTAVRHWLDRCKS